jgi:Ser/Thr protein kinase RdoA (MazF antagonist)
VDLQARVDSYLSRTGRVAGKVEIQRPQWGRHSEVFLLDDGKTRSVLRAFPWVGFAQGYARTLAGLAGRNLPLPGYLWHDASLATLIRWQRVFCAEEFVEGSLMVYTGTCDAALEALLRSLARLHDEQSASWGPPEVRRRGEYRDALGADCRSHLGTLPETSSLIARGDRADWKRAFDVLWDKLPAIDDFSLLHGKLGTDDIIIGEDGKTATFIDLDGLHFGHYAHDLQTVLYDIASTPIGDEAPLLGKYLSYRRRTPDLDYARVAPFFRLRHHLRKLVAAHRHVDPERLASHPRATFSYAALCDLAREV